MPRHGWMPIILTTLLLISTVNYSPEPMTILEENNSDDYVSAQGKRSKSPLVLTANHENITLNESNQWMWLEFTPTSNMAWVNISFGSFDNNANNRLLTVQAYTHFNRCIYSSISINHWGGQSSLCLIPSVDKTILILVDLSNNGNSDWIYGDVEISLNIENYYAPPIVNPQEYLFPDEGLDTDSTTYNPIIASDSATGHFETDYDSDYFSVDVALNGIYQVNVTHDINLTVQRYAGDSDCDNGVISNTSTKYITCYVRSDSVTFQISNNSWQSSEIPESWSVEIEIMEIRPIEDDLHGDAPSINSNQQLRNGDVSIDATFMNAYDTDWYSINIDHGFDQRIHIVSEHGASLNFAEISKANQYCTLVTNADNNIASQVTIVAGIATQLICRTNHFSDVLDFSIGADGTTPIDTNYSLTVTKVENNSGLGVSDSGNVLDAPLRDSTNLLNQGIHAGGFLYPSDTKDQYSVIVPAKSTSTVTLDSDCAMIGSFTSYDRISSHTFNNNGDEAVNFVFVIQRVEQLNSNVPLNLYPTCLYDFKISHQPIFQSWQPSLNGRLSLNSAVLMPDQIGERAQSIANGSIPGTYAMTYIDLPPNEIATITATQSSGIPLNLVVKSDHNDDISGEGEVIIAGMIEVGRQYVSWHSLWLNGIDGSAITISMTLSSTQLLTDEVNEINSMATGYLGISNDEGYDTTDSWQLNNSDDASMISVRLTEIDSSLEAQINGGISETFCSNYGYNPSNGQYENYFDDVVVNLHKGAGKYTLRVDKLYGECVTTSINFPSTTSASATIKINGEIYNSVDLSDRVNYQLISHDLNIAASTFSDDINDYSLMTIPNDAIGTYYLQTIHETGFILDSSPIYITNTSTYSANEIHSLLESDEEPSIFINSWSPYTYIPSNWNLQNIQLFKETINGTEFLQTFENISGNGLNKIEFELDSELNQGTRITMQAELVIDDTIQMISFNWIKGFLRLETECQASIQPVVGEPESDLICTIEGRYNSQGARATNSDITGTLEIYNGDGTMLESHNFTLQNGIANLRIPTWDFNEDEYYAVANSIHASNTTSIMNRIDNFFVDETLDPESDYSDLGVFEFTAYSIKQNAMAGDEIVIQWLHNGESISSIKWSLVSGLYQNGASFTVEDNLDEGTISISLPTNLNLGSHHSIVIEAYSIYGQVISKNIIVYGPDNSADVFVDINPQRPSTGEEFTVTITAPSANEWLSYSWTLTHNGAILSSGTGWNGANEASFKVALPIMHFTSDVVLTVFSEDHSGMFFSNGVTFQPIPLRDIHVNTDDHGVSGDLFDFAFSIKGEQLNSIDSVKSAKVRIISMTDVVIQEEIFIINSKSGKFSTLIPQNTAPGTYLLTIEFELLDGDIFQHSELLTILGQEEGVSVFGLVTIPSLPHGIDTIIVAILAIFLLIKGGKKLKNKKWNNNYFSSIDDDDDDDYEDEEFSAEDMFAGTGFTPSAPILSEIPMEPIESELDDSDIQSPQYETQEYPAGSGHWWERNSVEEEWQKI